MTSNYSGTTYSLQCAVSDTSLAQCEQTTAAGDCSEELAAVRCAGMVIHHYQ